MVQSRPPDQRAPTTRRTNSRTRRSESHLMTRGYSQLYVHLSEDSARLRVLMTVFPEDRVCRAVWAIPHCQAFWEGMVKLVFGLVFLVYRSTVRLEGESGRTASIFQTTTSFTHPECCIIFQIGCGERTLEEVRQSPCFHTQRTARLGVPWCQHVSD